MNKDFENVRGALLRRVFLLAWCAAAVALACLAQPPATEDLSTPGRDQGIHDRAQEMGGPILLVPPSAGPLFTKHFPLPVIAAVCALLFCSAFFSGSETAFFSINKLRMRSLKEDDSVTGTVIAKTMEHPGRLLTTVLIGNMIVNTLTGIILGSRAEEFFSELTQQRATLQASRDLLEQLWKRHEGFSAGVTAMLDAARPEVIGIVAYLVDVQPGYAAALESALGELWQAVAVPDTGAS